MHFFELLLPVSLLSIGGLSCSPPPEPVPSPPQVVIEEEEVVVEKAAWPDPKLVLRSPAYEIPKDFGVHRIYLDPGHGAERNQGNLSALCEREKDTMATIAKQVAERLRATGAFEVRVSRKLNELVPYGDRLNEAKRWKAEAFISFHSDARGYYTEDAKGCRHNDADPGFSVLYSDEGTSEMASSRVRLARSIAGQMGLAGFLPYNGSNYTGLYEGGDGVFVDRHADKKRIMFLRRPKMPSVIIETHHALDRVAARRWNKVETTDAFGDAIISALIQWFNPEPVEEQGVGG